MKNEHCCLQSGRLLEKFYLCAWPDCVFFLHHPLAATAGNGMMSYRNLCSATQWCSCVTLSTCCREHTYHGPGFNLRFQAVKIYTLWHLTFNHLFDSTFVQSCLQGERDEITYNTLEIEIVVTQFPFQKKIYRLSLLTAPLACLLSYCVFYQATLAKILHCSYNQSDWIRIYLAAVCVPLCCSIQVLGCSFFPFTGGIII